MTAPAPYTRDTLDRIRHRRASASDLGWPEDRYRSVCRHHGIEPVASLTPPVEPPKPAPPPQPTRIAGNIPIAASNYVTACLTPDHSERLMAKAKALGFRKGALMRKVIEAALDQDIIELLVAERGV